MAFAAKTLRQFAGVLLEHGGRTLFERCYCPAWHMLHDPSVTLRVCARALTSPHRPTTDADSEPQLNAYKNSNGLLDFRWPNLPTRTPLRFWQAPFDGLQLRFLLDAFAIMPLSKVLLSQKRNILLSGRHFWGLDSYCIGNTPRRASATIPLAPSPKSRFPSHSRYLASTDATCARLKPAADCVVNHMHMPAVQQAVERNLYQFRHLVRWWSAMTSRFVGLVWYMQSCMQGPHSVLPCAAGDRMTPVRCRTALRATHLCTCRNQRRPGRPANGSASAGPKTSAAEAN